MQNDVYLDSKEFTRQLAGDIIRNNKISRDTYDKYDVKRGLRNKDGTGVIAGITHIGNVIGYEKKDGKKRVFV